MIKKITILISVMLSCQVLAGPESICGTTDDRVLSYDAKIGRLSQLGEYKGCTATLISDSCAITAGHCLEVLDVIEFNTTASKDGEPVPSADEDFYVVDRSSIKSFAGLPGDDYAVFKIKPNAFTKKLPGVVQGHYTISYDLPKVGSKIKITGYGVDEGDSLGNFAQQTHDGIIKSYGGYFSTDSINHTVDTMGGNSGSSIILQETNEIIGIHTHGGCSAWGGTNQGTLIAKHKELRKAIKLCLDSEK